jgi:hypothetical protein
MLAQLGVEEKTKFEKNWERGISIVEARKRSLHFIDKMWKK